METTRVELREECRIRGGGTSFGSEPYLVTICDNVLISSNVQFLTHDGSVHTIVSQEKYHDKPVHKYGRIVVGENTFIGANVVILPNVYIGKNCIIGAGSVVTKSIPDNSVVAGVPARVINDLESYSEKVISFMTFDWDNHEYRNNCRNYLLKILPEPEHMINQ